MSCFVAGVGHLPANTTFSIYPIKRPKIILMDRYGEFGLDYIVTTVY